jgi:methionyl-tRNA formyltransferase
MNIWILSDENSWINHYLEGLYHSVTNDGHDVHWVHTVAELKAGDICFLLGCGQIVPEHKRARFKNCVVVHESNLPQGRGWSPMSWQVLEGKDDIPICLLEAGEGVDSGVVYLRSSITLVGTELVDELRQKQAKETLKLVQAFLHDFDALRERGELQVGEPSYYPRRSAADSEVDPERTLLELFDALRVADNERYPAFFSASWERV